MNTIRITEVEMQMFAKASKDVNPLHVSADYARTTSYGEPVVFGILSTLAALQFLPDTDKTLTSVSLEFKNPVFVNVDYSVEVQEKKSGILILSVSDGSQVILVGKFTFSSHEGNAFSFVNHNGFGKIKAAEWDEASLSEGLSIKGEYAPSTTALQQLAIQYKLGKKGIGLQQMIGLIWSSYAVGMEMPGNSAAYYKLKMSFPAWQAEPCSHMTFIIKVADFDERFDLLTTEAKLLCNNQPIAEAEIASFVRRASPVSDKENLLALLHPSEKLKGKTALLIGGSRGLGAGIAQALASQGCFVILNYNKSESEARQVFEGLPTSYKHELLQGDASDSDTLPQMADTISQKHGGLDILVCNACPTIRFMPFESQTLERMNAFVQSALALAIHPLAAFLPAINKNAGNVIMVSSEYAETSPVGFAHYTAAKCAAEGYVQSIAKQFRNTWFLIPRPPKLLTDQTNTSVGRIGSAPVHTVASAIVHRLCEKPSSWNEAEIMDDFTINNNLTVDDKQVELQGLVRT